MVVFNKIDYCNFLMIEVKTGMVHGYYGEHKYGRLIPKKLPKGFIYLPSEDAEKYRATRIRQNGKIVRERVDQRVLNRILKQGIYSRADGSIAYEDSRNGRNRRKGAPERRMSDERRERTTELEATDDSH